MIFDFFLDGGLFNFRDFVIVYVVKMVVEGVFIIDVGGEFMCLGVVLVLE